MELIQLLVELMSFHKVGNPMEMAQRDMVGVDMEEAIQQEVGEGVVELLVVTLVEYIDKVV